MLKSPVLMENTEVAFHLFNILYHYYIKILQDGLENYKYLI